MLFYSLFQAFRQYSAGEKFTKEKKRGGRLEGEGLENLELVVNRLSEGNWVKITF